MDQIIVRPIITEKSMDETAHSRFTFEVARDANKPMIKKAVEEQFKVNVLDLQTMTVHGKRKRVGRTRRESQDQYRAKNSLGGFGPQDLPCISTHGRGDENPLR